MAAKNRLEGTDAAQVVWETMSLEQVQPEHQSDDPESPAPASLHCRIVHQVGRRVRLRIEPAGVLTELGDALEAFLREQNGVVEVALNHACDSVRLDVDPDGVTALIAAVDDL